MLNMILNAGMTYVFSVGFDEITSRISKDLSTIFPSLGRLAGSESYSTSYNMALTRLVKGQIENFTWKTLCDGIISVMQGNFISNIMNGLIDAKIELAVEKALSPQN